MNKDDDSCFQLYLNVFPIVLFDEKKTKNLFLCDFVHAGECYLARTENTKGVVDCKSEKQTLLQNAFSKLMDTLKDVMNLLG